MIRTLLVIAGAATVLCVATLAGAAAIGGNDLARHGWVWTFHDEDGDDVRFERVSGDLGPSATRTLPWAGGAMLVVDLPGEVTYVQGDAKRVTVTGPQTLVDRVQLLQGDRLTFNDGDNTEQVLVRWGPGGLRAHDEGLKITVTAPDVTLFDVSSSANLLIRNYDKPRLSLVMSGSGDVRVEGRTEDARLDLSGSGDADLAGLELTNATIDIDGSGDVEAAASGQVDVDISGSGDVSLTRRPTRLNQTGSGSGDVHQN